MTAGSAFFKHQFSRVTSSFLSYVKMNYGFLLTKWSVCLSTYRAWNMVWGCGYLGKGGKERERVCSQVWWPILGICAFNPSKCTHTVVNIHPEQWAANAAAPGDQLGVRCLAQGSHLSRGIEGGESAGYSLPPPTIPAGPETRTHDLRVTSPTLYPLGHDCLIYCIYWKFSPPSIQISNLTCLHIQTQSYDTQHAEQQLKHDHPVTSCMSYGLL